MPPRPTRWEKARADTEFPRFRRSALTAGVGAVLSVAVLLIGGFGHDALIFAITVGASALAAAVVVPLVELAWNALQAPMRLLTEDVIAIRERLEAAPQPVAEAPVNVRLTLLNYARQGQRLSEQAFLTPMQEESWASGVAAFVGAHVRREDAERFVRAPNLRAHVEVLREIADDYPG